MLAATDYLEYLVADPHTRVIFKAVGIRRSADILRADMVVCDRRLPRPSPHRASKGSLYTRVSRLSLMNSVLRSVFLALSNSPEVPARVCPGTALRLRCRSAGAPTNFILLCVKHLTLLMADEWVFSFARKFGPGRVQILG